MVVAVAQFLDNIGALGLLTTMTFVAMFRSTSSLRSPVRVSIALAFVLALMAGLWLRQFVTRPKYKSHLARTVNGTAVHWLRSEIVLHPVLPRQTVSPSDFLQALKFGIDAWNGALNGCRVPKLRLGSIIDDLHKLRQDGVSMIVIRAGFWCGDDDLQHESCFDRTIEAITSVYPGRNPGQPEEGALREADIQINAVDFTWSLDGQRPGTRNLSALITHELGHVLGLDHMCNSKDAIVSNTILNPTAPVCDPSNTHASIMYPLVTTDTQHGNLLPGRSEVALLCGAYADSKSRER